MNKLELKESPKFECGIVVSFGEDGEVFMKHGRNGSCEHCSAEAIARLINLLPKEKVIKELKHLSCKNGLTRYKSCFDFVAKSMEVKNG